MADTSIAHMTYLGGPMTKPSLSAVRDPNPSKTSPCSRCQHPEFIHAYAGPCLFHDCECPFFIPEAEPDVEEGRAESRPPAWPPELALQPIAFARSFGRYRPNPALRPIVFAGRPADTKPMKLLSS